MIVWFVWYWVIDWLIDWLIDWKKKLLFGKILHCLMHSGQNCLFPYERAVSPDINQWLASIESFLECGAVLTEVSSFLRSAYRKENRTVVLYSLTFDCNGLFPSHFSRLLCKWRDTPRQILFRCVPLGWSGSRSVIRDLSGSWCIKGTDESITLVMKSAVPLMYHGPDRSWITNPYPDHPKGTHALSADWISIIYAFNQIWDQSHFLM